MIKLSCVLKMFQGRTYVRGEYGLRFVICALTVMKVDLHPERVSLPFIGVLPNLEDNIFGIESFVSTGWLVVRSLMALGSVTRSLNLAWLLVLSRSRSVLDIVCAVVVMVIDIVESHFLEC